LEGQWRYSIWTDKLATTMQIAKRLYSLAQEQNDSTLMIGAYRALAATFYFLGDFDSARQNAMRGVQIWRSGGVQSRVEDINAPVVICLCFRALSEWQSGEIASCQVTMAEAILLAKELNDMHGLAFALYFGGILARFERNPAEAERFASELIELSTHYNFAFWLPGANVLRGWARSVSGDTTEGISWIEDGIGDYRATGSMLLVPLFLALKAEALHLAERIPEALEAIREAEALVERFEGRCWFGELYRLRGVFLAAIGADETLVGVSFNEAIRIAREQKSISLEKRAEGTYAEYRRRKASASGGRGFRLPLC
jgi:tetratricopeptide (TPR) repeat protein